MGSYIGTSADEEITPAFMSSSVDTTGPSRPGGADGVLTGEAATTP
jgi:hypothetical protein